MSFLFSMAYNKVIECNFERVTKARNEWQFMKKTLKACHRHSFRACMLRISHPHLIRTQNNLQMSSFVGEYVKQPIVAND